MTLVVDSSVAFKWFVPEEFFENARQLLRGAEPLLAPDFILVEVANTIWKTRRRGEWSGTSTREILTMLRADLQLIPSEESVDEASDLSEMFDHSVYDCLYIAVARRYGVPLITADRGLYAKLSTALAIVHPIWLADFKQGMN